MKRTSDDMEMPRSSGRGKRKKGVTAEQGSSSDPSFGHAYTEDKVSRRRERNKANAKKARARAKQEFIDMKNSVKDLRFENDLLRQEVAILKRELAAKTSGTAQPARIIPTLEALTAILSVQQPADTSGAQGGPQGSLPGPQQAKQAADMCTLPPQHSVDRETAVQEPEGAPGPLETADISPQQAADRKGLNIQHGAGTPAGGRAGSQEKDVEKQTERCIDVEMAEEEVPIEVAEALASLAHLAGPQNADPQAATTANTATKAAALVGQHRVAKQEANGLPCTPHSMPNHDTAAAVFPSPAAMDPWGPLGPAGGPAQGLHHTVPPAAGCMHGYHSTHDWGVHNRGIEHRGMEHRGMEHRGIEPFEQLFARLATENPECTQVLQQLLAQLQHSAHHHAHQPHPTHTVPYMGGPSWTHSRAPARPPVGAPASGLYQNLAVQAPLQQAPLRQGPPHGAPQSSLAELSQLLHEHALSQRMQQANQPMHVPPYGTARNSVADIARLQQQAVARPQGPGAPVRTQEGAPETPVPAAKPVRANAIGDTRAVAEEKQLQTQQQAGQNS